VVSNPKIAPSVKNQKKEEKKGKTRSPEKQALEKIVMPSNSGLGGEKAFERVHPRHGQRNGRCD